MIQKKEDLLTGLKSNVHTGKKLVEEIEKNFILLERTHDPEQVKNISHQINSLKEKLKNLNDKIPEILNLANIAKPLKFEKKKKGEMTKIKTKVEEEELNPLKSKGGRIYSKKELFLKGLEKETIRRIKEKKQHKKTTKKKKPKNQYAQVADKIFSNVSKSLLGKETFQRLEQNLIKANLNYSPTGYISVILLTTLLSAFVGGFIFFFFLFFNVGAAIPLVTRAMETINIRFLKVFWILLVVPLGTFFMMYVYPSLEKKSSGMKIDLEIPFATIHMAAISGSMINPIKIFEIIVSTKEYPALGKEFIKLLNEINIYGSDFVSALKNSAKNTSSKKLGELLNGLATTINSGGDLPSFFDKRSQTLLFEHQIEVEKSAKAAETFMDIYISVVIAAPMILMILLMMMKLSGLGIGLSVNMITLVMILAVTGVNAVFLTFLNLRRKQ
ncbi:hypothetical protein HOD29_01965 [archaeon]|nr:hypothetical protein [archaeon]